jgi:hypothetical protein
MHTATEPVFGATEGAVRVIVRTEAAVVLAAAVAAYVHLGGGWLTFALLFFVPDVALFGYLAGPRVGAAVYNALHSYIGPALLYLGRDWMPLAELLCMVWLAHIAFDRCLGYGLKYARGFVHTHLGRIGERG